jgi:hypothetical protein
MLGRPWILLTWAVALAAHAQPVDPLKTPECGRAIATLQSARASGAATEGLRHEAARICLGSGAPPQRPARVLQQPVTVPPPQLEAAPRASLPRPPSALPAPVQIDRPATVSGCDPGGCWVDDGVRLQRVAPNLMAPGGLCAQAPGAAGCP